ncbi:MAG: DoxX family protein [Candidatus Nanopelagicales bacterium]
MAHDVAEVSQQDGRLPVGTLVLVGAFTLSGAVHLARPDVFDSLIPPVLGPPRPWTYASGVAELVCATGLATRQPWAPKATAGLLAVVWVGNWWMAVAATRAERRTPALVALSWARIPLQIPMIRAALRSPVRPRP